MPNQTTPRTGNSVNAALELAALLRPLWDDINAGIPAWHPRNEETPEERAAREAASSAAQVDWESDDNPYRKRYADTQGAYTQGQQELARLKRYEEDPQAYYELGAKHGVQFEFEEPAEGSGVDPAVAELRQQNAELMRWRESVEADRQVERAAAGEELFHQDLDLWAETEGVKLSQSDHNAIFGLLMKSPDPSQESTARQIFEAHVAHKKSEREAWEQEYEQARRRPRVPTVPTDGATHTGTPKWSEMSDSDIDEYMAQRAAGNV